MSGINVTITGSPYAGTIIGNKYTISSPSSQKTGEWVSSNGFLYQNTSFLLLVFNSDNTVSNATSPSNFTAYPTLATVSGASWSGTIPATIINSARNQINSGEEELYRVQGSVNDSFYSSYQDTLLAGILVAMLGTTVLFYTFRQL
jgi:hypothetical protein